MALILQNAPKGCVKWADKGHFYSKMEPGNAQWRNNTEGDNHYIVSGLMLNIMRHFWSSFNVGLSFYWNWFTKNKCVTILTCNISFLLAAFLSCSHLMGTFCRRGDSRGTALRYQWWLDSASIFYQVFSNLLLLSFITFSDIHVRLFSSDVPFICRTSLPLASTWWVQSRFQTTFL